MKLIFLPKKANIIKKTILPEESRKIYRKDKKFGVDWYIPYKMPADSVRGSINRVKTHRASKNQ